MQRQQRKFTIGRLARDTGCKAQTIRYYEEIGLLPTPERSHGNQRLYGPSDSARLAFIRHSRELGFPLTMVRELLALVDDPAHPCADVDRITRTHLETVDRRIKTLMSLKAELERMIEQCDGGAVSTCRIIEVLADHSLCQVKAHREQVS